MTRISARLADTDDDLGGVLEALRTALRLPFAALRGIEAERKSSGVAPAAVRAIPLTYRGGRVGELIVGLRSGERELDPADRAVLELLAAPLAVALFATTLSGELQRSRERIVTAREEERRRLRRDLHDGLGPALTGVTLQADLARTLVPIDPDRAVELLGELRRSASGAIDDIRRVAYGLRPPALDELGLLAAVRQQAAQLTDGAADAPTEITFDLPTALPTLPAAVESAAYRITVEAIANALRHTAEHRVNVRIGVGKDLCLEIRDEGAPRGLGPSDPPAVWTAGVGLRSMRERAAELGGTCVAGPTPEGGVVTARLPLWTHDPRTQGDDDDR
jgi:signal transduction histidine kinase